MKILLVGNQSPYNAEFFYKKAFSELGNNVSLINSYNGIDRQLFYRIIYTRTNLLKFNLQKLSINRILIEKVDEIDPDIILFFKGELISPKILSLLSENRSIYLFYPDTYKFKPLLKRELKHFKSVFTASNKKSFYYKLGAKHVWTVPWACDPEFHKKINIQKRFDVSFIGTAYWERRKIIRRLSEVEVFGDFWYGMGEHSHAPVYGNDFIKTINETKINLNLQSKVSIKADAPTMRTFELAGCGGFQISDYMHSLKDYFPMIPTFKDENELKNLISYYIDNEEEALNISIKTMEKCQAKYKYIDTAKIILSKI
ncbi:MAG: glycosyltransferase [Thermoplasmatales archaeon]|nr:MAG: glycosyltransferase [Thermoplasmatales archaeon]